VDHARVAVASQGVDIAVRPDLHLGAAVAEVSGFVAVGGPEGTNLERDQIAAP
jgi:hypothetical protein